MREVLIWSVESRKVFYCFNDHIMPKLPKLTAHICMWGEVPNSPFNFTVTYEKVQAASTDATFKASTKRWDVP